MSTPPEIPPLYTLTRNDCTPTRREWFVMAALTGLCANASLATVTDRTLAELAVRQADYAIKILDENPEETP